MPDLGSHAVVQAGVRRLCAPRARERAADTAVAIEEDPAVARAVDDERRAGLCRPGWARDGPATVAADIALSPPGGGAAAR